MICTFTCKDTQRLFGHNRVLRFLSIEPIARRKLEYLDKADALSDLAVPPGNRLEILKGNYKGYHSIRINDQWRLIFRWENDGVYDVAIVDYHK